MYECVEYIDWLWVSISGGHIRTQERVFDFVQV